MEPVAKKHVEVTVEEGPSKRVIVDFLAKCIASTVPMTEEQVRHVIISEQQQGCCILELAAAKDRSVSFCSVAKELTPKLIWRPGVARYQIPFSGGAAGRMFPAQVLHGAVNAIQEKEFL